MDIPAIQTETRPNVKRRLTPWVLVPREHGAWAMLFVPAIIGLGLAALWSVRIPLFLGAVLFLYLARYPLFLWARSGAGRLPQGWLFSLVISLALGCALAAPLLLYYGLWWLPVLGTLAAAVLALHLYLVRQRKERSIAGEFLGVLGLALTAPAAYYTVSGSLNSTAWLLWLLCATFFGSSIFYVKLKVGYPARSRKSLTGSRIRAAAPLWLYHAGALAVVAVLGLLGVAPVWTVLAFVPVAAQAVVGGLNTGSRPSLKKLGFTQLGHSLLFAALLVAIMRLGTP